MGLALRHTATHTVIKQQGRVCVFVCLVLLRSSIVFTLFCLCVRACVCVYVSVCRYVCVCV